MATQREKADLFRTLHSSPKILVLANSSDVASSRIVVEAGFPAVATSSASIAWLLGYPDGEHIPRAEMLDMVGRIARSVDVPVTADMEAGYGREPEDVAETVRLTVAAGAVGLNIEDGAPAGSDPPVFGFDLSVARIRAAREAADATGLSAVINARTDVFLRGGKGDAAFDETVRRTNAFRAAGADCLFVPGVRDAETIGRLAKAIEGPLNILAAAPTPPVDELARLGVARVSIGGLFGLATASLIRRAAKELATSGTYGFAEGVVLHPEMNALMR